MARVTDDDLTLSGDPILQGVVVRDTSALRVTFVNNRNYDIPIDYLQSWFSKGPHEVAHAQKALTAEVVRDGDMLRVSLPDGAVYLVAWDVILMACEPEYVHFGGFTEYSKRIAKRWLEKAAIPPTA